MLLLALVADYIIAISGKQEGINGGGNNDGNSQYHAKIDEWTE